MNDDVSYRAPVGSVDLAAFNEAGEPYEIFACSDCLPWYAEVINDPETNAVFVREWHAIGCRHFQELIRHD